MLGLSALDTPLGLMALVHGEGGLLWAAEFCADPARIRTSIGRFVAEEPVDAPLPEPLRQAFSAYFAGDLHALETLPTASFGTDFEPRVWAELRRIPPGATRSYGEMARLLGDPGASRAVGIANSRNPLAIVVPCHRVIGADGSLTGYAGGLHNKEWLLRHEGWSPRQERML